MRFHAAVVALLASTACARPISEAERGLIEPHGKRLELTHVVEDLTEKLPTRQLGGLTGLLGSLTNGLKAQNGSGSGLPIRTLSERQLGSVTDLLSSLTGGIKHRDVSALEDISKELPVRQLDSLTSLLSSLTGNLRSRQLDGLTQLLSSLTGVVKARQLDSLTQTLSSLTGNLKPRQLNALEGAIASLSGDAQAGGASRLGQLNNVPKEHPIRQLGNSESTLTGLFSDLSGKANNEVRDLGSTLSRLSLAQRQLESFEERQPSSKPSIPILATETNVDVGDI